MLIPDASIRTDLPASLISRVWGRFGWLEAAFLVVVAGALGMRLWELGGRTMHYDEAIHVHFAWQLLNSEGGRLGWPWVFGSDYLHSPWMHGPFQVELTAFIFRIFGDTEFTARLAYVLFGTGLVALPYFLREHLGRYGALLAAVMLALSPTLLYFSRFGRNDIIMVFLAVALLVLVWRYLQEGRRTYLYLSSAVLALMFASKETAYLVVAIFGLLLLVMALPDIVPWALGRLRPRMEDGPLGPLVLLVTLTLPQWMAGFGLFQGALGLTLANPDPQTGQNVANPDGSQGLIGAPAWEGSTLLLPVTDVPWTIHAALVAIAVTALLWMVGRGPPGRRTASAIAAPLLATAGVALLLFRPLHQSVPVSGIPVFDLLLAVLCLAGGVAVLVAVRYPWQKGALLLLVPVLVTTVYSVLLTPLVNVQGLVNAILPSNVVVTAVDNGVPANYVVALVLLGGSLIVSVVLGVRWLGSLWLACAGVFYVIWAALYTTLFTNISGLFSGSWQGMGYWIAQQDVARGNQPWYYYFVGLSVYELLPLLFGVAAAVYFVRKRDVLGLALAFWAGISIVGYTIASEKMPWLLVNMAVPLILLSAKFLGDLVERVDWREELRRGPAVLLLLAPISAVAVVFLGYDYATGTGGVTIYFLAALAAILLLLSVTAVSLFAYSPGRSAPLAFLGIAALLLGFGSWTAFRAGYTYDDSNREILVYAQGAADLRDAYRSLVEDVFPANTPDDEVLVDYDLWYPFVWYVRDHDRNGELGFACFKEREDHSWNSSCISPSERADSATNAPVPSLFMVKTANAGETTGNLKEFQRDGPFHNMIWFPESYRRPGEDRPGEGLGEEISMDFRFFKDTLVSRRSWDTMLSYWLFRDLPDNWFTDDYYVYRR